MKHATTPRPKVLVIPHANGGWMRGLLPSLEPWLDVRLTETDAPAVSMAGSASYVPDVVIFELGEGSDADLFAALAVVRTGLPAGLPLLVATGRLDETLRQFAKDLGVSDFLVAPFGASEAVARVEAQLPRPMSREPKRDARSDELTALHESLAFEIKERRRTLRAFEELDQLLRCIARASPLPIVALDRAGLVQLWTPAAERLFQWTQAQVIGRPYPPMKLKSELDELTKITLAGGSVADVVTRRQRRDGSFVDVAVWTTAIRGAEDEVTGSLEIIVDMTERRDLLMRLVSAEEQERRRISRELHDHIGQQITAILLNLKTIDDGLEPAAPVRRQLAAVRKLANDVGQAVHQKALELRPTALDDLGLAAALANHIEGWAVTTGITVDFHCHGLDERLSVDIESGVYRIVQEALTNVAKHSGAGRVSLILEGLGGELVVIVEDDGRGFDAVVPSDPARRGGHLGLATMRERVALLDGRLEIESTPKHGTTVFVRIPLANRREVT